MIGIFYVFKYINNNKESFESSLEENDEITYEGNGDTENESEPNYFHDVYVHGEVYKSGIYHVPNNWTLDKLFNLVGLKGSADVSGFNLAEVVVDNGDYFIPKKNTFVIGDTSLIVNISTASKEELMLLPGIGEVIAERIIVYRNKKQFSSIEDIKNVSGIGDAVYEKIKDYITVR